jgi:hypothetical protein
MRTAGLSINLATVRQQWNLRQAVEACARHGIGAIDPWRDQVAAIGLDESVRVIKANGMRVTGYCRGGMFPGVDAKPRGKRPSTTTSVRSTRRARSMPNAWSWWWAACRKDRATSARRAGWWRTASARFYPTLAPPAMCRLRLSRCIRCMPADRACVNTLAQALDLCDAVGRRRRRRHRYLSRLVGPGS